LTGSGCGKAPPAPYFPTQPAPLAIDEQIKSLDDFKKNGAHFWDNDGKGPVTFINLEYLNIRGPALVHLKSVADTLTGFECHSDVLSDEGLAHVAPLKNLETLSLSSAGISDNGLQHLAGLTKLEALDLSQTKITDAGLKHLAGLTN